MTRPWNLAESRLIAERVMEWQVFEFEGRLWLTDPGQRPKWLCDCVIPDWPRDPAAGQPGCRWGYPRHPEVSRRYSIFHPTL